MRTAADAINDEKHDDDERDNNANDCSVGHQGPLEVEHSTIHTLKTKRDKFIETGRYRLQSVR